MKLYIETENGQTKNHPAFEDNLIQAFGDIPDHWEPFVRVEMPKPGLYQVLVSEQPTYEKVDGVWTDVWNFREMTNEEKLNKQNFFRQMYEQDPNFFNFSAWIFDEETCSYKPPKAKPTDTPPEGKMYRWQGSTNNWVLTDTVPDDGKIYEWNFTRWKWDEVTTS
jgi:hypothetical protein